MPTTIVEPFQSNMNHCVASFVEAILDPNSQGEDIRATVKDWVQPSEIHSVGSCEEIV